MIRLFIDFLRAKIPVNLERPYIFAIKTQICLNFPEQQCEMLKHRKNSKNACKVNTDFKLITTYFALNREK